LLRLRATVVGDVILSRRVAVGRRPIVPEGSGIAFAALNRPERIWGYFCEREGMLVLPRPRSTVVFREVPEGAILFCTRKEVYFSLNQLGVMIWRLLPPECATEDEIVARVSQEYPSVNLGTIAADVRRLIEDLAKHDLVEAQRAA